jgi:hypothetical protein
MEPMTLHPYTILALPPGDDPPQRIGIMAWSRADAITTAQELYPSWRVSAVLLEGEWE